MNLYEVLDKYYKHDNIFLEIQTELRRLQMNQSKVRDLRFWRKWHLSGATPKEQFPEGSLVIEGIGTHYVGPAAGHQTLSLGRRLVASGPDWASYKTLTAVIVPTNDKYKMGMVLPCIPGNAVPINIFFPNL